MDAKYQIFISSTFSDLQIERDSVMKGILKLGHIPVGMELFNAGDLDTWQLIQKQIDESDYYVVIVAHRYGTMDGKLSYTEKEYNYARKRNVPIIGFLIDESAPWSTKYRETDPNILRSLKEFKIKVGRKSCQTWVNVADLNTKVILSLESEIKRVPQEGLVRPNGISYSRSSEPDYLQIALKTKPKRIYVIGSSLGRSGKVIKDLVCNTNAEVFVYCSPISRLASVTHNEAKTSLEAVFRDCAGKSNFHAYVVDSPPSINLKAFCDNDDNVLELTLYWYTFYDGYKIQSGKGGNGFIQVSKKKALESDAFLKWAKDEIKNISDYLSVKFK